MVILLVRELLPESIQVGNYFIDNKYFLNMHQPASEKDHPPRALRNTERAGHC